MIALQEGPFILGLAYFVAFCAGTVLGLVVAAIGWGGARAGMIVGALVMLLGAAVLVDALVSPWPGLWWISAVPIYAGWLAMSAWRRRGDSVKRLPVRFRLRGLLLFVVVFSIVLGGVTMYTATERFEQQLVAPLRGIVNVHQSVFGRADFIILHAESEADFDRAMAALDELDAIRSLQVNESNVPAARATRRLAGLTSLRWLSLQHLRVGDADLEPLGKLRRLETLELDASQLTDAGLVHLYPLKRLEKLYLYHADPQKVTPQGLKRLHAELPNLPPDYP